MGIDRTSVDHHIQVLQRTTDIRTARIGQHLVVSLPGQDPAKAVPTAAARAQDVILRTVRSAGGLLPRDRLNEILTDMPTRTRNHALNELAEQGLLHRDWDGRRETLRLRGIPPAASASYHGA
ncbi:MAG TPA: hypothetical protein VM370_11840 [Candidatus Thermoplasmatota archaeon]|nr:hypothetical protein [Candidatus Thermoplasmatota archaeon]